MGYNHSSGTNLLAANKKTDTPKGKNMNSFSMFCIVVLSAMIGSYWHFRKTHCIRQPWKRKWIQLHWSLIGFILTT